MSDERDNTIAQRPLPRRPQVGIMAWIATIGFISTQYSPDATLKLHVSPAQNGELRWAAQAAWAQHKEQVWDCATLGTALTDLWGEVDGHHLIFDNKLDAVRSPVNYAENEWLDDATRDMLERLIVTAQNAFSHDWQLVIVYQPVDTPETRVQARLIARGDSVQVGGRGPSVKDACRDLYRNGTRDFLRGSE